MEDYVAERREMPKKMKKAIEKVTAKDADKGLAALLAYYASQQ